jgi:Ca2+/Na+ antiporter
MFNRNKISSIVFSIYILLSFYVFGGGVVNALVAYRTWRWVGPAEFPKFHHVDSELIIPLFVIFFFLSFIPQILLFWFRPVAIPKWLVFSALLFNLIVLISTITIQIPIQTKLDQAFSLELIDKLINTDMIFRRIPMLLLAVTNFTMLYMVVKRSNK